MFHRDYDTRVPVPSLIKEKFLACFQRLQKEVCPEKSKRLKAIKNVSSHLSIDMVNHFALGIVADTSPKSVGEDKMFSLSFMKRNTPINDQLTRSKRNEFGVVMTRETYRISGSLLDFIGRERWTCRIYPTTFTVKVHTLIRGQTDEKPHVSSQVKQIPTLTPFYQTSIVLNEL